jgi:hypothetical protein
MAKPIPKPIRSRRATRAVLPHSTGNLKLLNPSNEDIIKVIDEIKANQQRFLDEYNKLICMKINIDALSIADSGVPFLSASPTENIQLAHYHSLPPL